ncbi:hypothetical protein BJX76DRAFT_368333 [Aspergillus varians]
MADPWINQCDETHPVGSLCPPYGKPKEVPIYAMEEYALRAFFYDYCITPVNPEVSRGFLAGLESMVHHQGLQSQVAKACKAIAFASHGLKLNRPFLTRKAEELYHELLTTLAHAIKDPTLINRADAAVMAILLGLFEMMLADGIDSGNHRAHAGGLAALLQIENSPLALLAAVSLGWSLLANGGQVSRLKSGIFSFPCFYGRGNDLDSLLIRLGSICKESHALSSQTSAQPDAAKLAALREDAWALNHDISQWQLSQREDSSPITIGHLIPNAADPSPQAGYWPGRVDIYIDFYVAAVWNASRLARCLVINCLIQLSDILNDDSTTLQTRQDLFRQVEDIIASIPYHFTSDVRSFLRCAHGESREIASPERPAAGLLLMHPIYVVSTLPSVAPGMQEYMRKCLSWIGTHMGIGQASLLGLVGGTLA